MGSRTKRKNREADHRRTSNTSRLGKWNNRIHLQERSWSVGIWALPAYMHEEDHLQNLARAHREKLIKIAHILTINSQYGYKEGISTIDAAVKIEQYKQYRIGHRRCRNPAHGPLESLRYDGQNAALDNALQERATWGNDKTHTKRTPRNKTSAEIQ